jgi:hypothetical protein
MLTRAATTYLQKATCFSTVCRLCLFSLSVPTKHSLDSLPFVSVQSLNTDKTLTGQSAVCVCSVSQFRQNTHWTVCRLCLFSLSVPTKHSLDSLSSVSVQSLSSDQRLTGQSAVCVCSVSQFRPNTHWTVCRLCLFSLSVSTKHPMDIFILATGTVLMGVYSWAQTEDRQAVIVLNRP